MLKLGYRKDACGDDYYIGNTIELCNGEHFIDKYAKLVVENNTITKICIINYDECTRVIVKDETDIWEVRLIDILRNPTHLHGGHSGHYGEMAMGCIKLNSYKDDILRRLLRDKSSITII